MSANQAAAFTVLPSEKPSAIPTAPTFEDQYSFQFHGNHQNQAQDTSVFSAQTAEESYSATNQKYAELSYYTRLAVEPLLEIAPSLNFTLNLPHEAYFSFQEDLSNSTQIQAQWGWREAARYSLSPVGISDYYQGPTQDEVHLQVGLSHAFTSTELISFGVSYDYQIDKPDQAFWQPPSAIGVGAAYHYEYTTNQAIDIGWQYDLSVDPSMISVTYEDDRNRGENHFFGAIYSARF